MRTVMFPGKEKVKIEEMKVQEHNSNNVNSEDCYYFVVLTIPNSLFNHIVLLGTIG